MKHSGVPEDLNGDLNSHKVNMILKDQIADELDSYKATWWFEKLSRCP